MVLVGMRERRDLEARAQHRLDGQTSNAAMPWTPN